MKDWWNLGFVLFLLLLGGYLCQQGLFPKPSPPPDSVESLCEETESSCPKRQNHQKEPPASQSSTIPLVWMERGEISPEERDEYLRTLLAQVRKTAEGDATKGEGQSPLTEKLKDRRAWMEWQAEHRFAKFPMASPRQKAVSPEKSRTSGISWGTVTKHSPPRDPSQGEKDSPEAEKNPQTKPSGEEKNPAEPEPASPEEIVPEKRKPEESYQEENIPYADEPVVDPYAEEGKEEPERPFLLHSLQQWEEGKGTITLLLSSNPYAGEKEYSHGLILSFPLPDGWKLTSARGNGQFRLQNRECKWFFPSREPLMAELIVMEIQKAEFPYSLKSTSTPVRQITGICIQNDGTQTQFQAVPMTTEALSELLYW